MQAIRHFCGILFGILALFHSAFWRHFIRHFCGISFGIFAAAKVLLFCDICKTEHKKTAIFQAV